MNREGTPANWDPASFNKQVIAEFRQNGGKVGPPFGDHLLLLTTRGAKTGQQRTSPVMYNQIDGRLLVFASKGGAPTNPDWYHNLVANPEVTVELGTETFKARAVVVTGAERDRLFSQHAQQFPGFGEYQANTTRTIPVVALERHD
jgi:deazaflavin-dependent oxidoreductase (nitroreductase family)